MTIQVHLLSLPVPLPTQLLDSSDGPPLGAGLDTPRPGAQTHVLLPGAILVAYSDGLVERRGTVIDEQIQTLQRVVDAACHPSVAGTADQIAEAILTALVPEPVAAEDDVCLLVVRRDPLRV